MEKRSVCMGIESTAHTFGVGLVDESGKILAEERRMYKPEKGKGIVPRKASEHHNQKAHKIIKTALDKGDVSVGEIDVIAFSQGPGLPPCIRVGATISRYLKTRTSADLIGVNHPVAHIEVGKLTTECDDPVVLYLSGGNTQIISYAQGRYRIFGETEDIAIGNALDTVARKLNLKSPGGPEIERLAKGGDYIELPYSVKGMDLSFSGIVTDVERKIKDGVDAKDISYSMQETCFAMLVEVTERALAHTGKDEVLLVGGVAANKRLQEMVRIMCEERGADMYVVDSKYAGDNGLMIAWTGMLAYKSGERTFIVDSGIKPKWKTDQMEISWLQPG